MSFSIDLIAFDYNKFKTEIIPSLKEGETNNLVKDVIKALDLNYETPSFQNEINQAHNQSFSGLKKVMSTFDDSLLRSRLGNKFAVLNGEVQTIDHTYNLPSKKHWGYEDLCKLFEYMTIQQCAKYYLTLGKQYSFEDFVVFNCNKNLAKLDGGCNYFQHGNGGFGEGVTGWLNEAEAASLFESLKEIDIDPADHYLDRIRMKEFIKLTEIAAKNNLGLLSGRDLRLNVRRSGILKLELSNHRSEDAYVNFDGEVVYNATYD